MNNFNKKKFFEIIRNYKSVLDYGCGYGILENSNKKIYLYDQDKKLIPMLKKKYKKNNSFKVLKNSKFKNIDVFFMNSVFQYLSNSQITFLKNKMSNFKIVLISDIPKYPRILEALFLVFLNPRRLILGLINFIKKKEPYTKLKFTSYSIKEIKETFKNFEIKIIPNLDNVKFTRYTIILKIK